jgi:hypothetical protein
MNDVSWEWPSLEDITQSLQKTISDASLKPNDQSSVTSIQVPKGDYAIQIITIPKNGRVLLFSKEKVRLLFTGKRNRPMFVLEENAALTLREKLEIYYNTNNVQEVANLMVKCPKSSRLDISKDVKISLFSMKQSE